MEKAIEIKDLYVNYEEGYALENVSLDVFEGDFIGIIGPNGGGKSTLLKSILGLVPVASGEVRVFGKEPKRREAAIGYVPQFSAIDRRFPITVIEAVVTGRINVKMKPFFRYSKEDKQAALAALDSVGIKKLADRRISDLSGGEFQRVLIARALATTPKILLLDEPTASVDPSSREAIYSLLDRLNGSMTIVMVTHDLFAVYSKVKKVACLNGRLVYHGEPSLSKEVVNELYGCPVELIAHGVPHRVLGEHGGDCCHD